MCFHLFNYLIFHSLPLPSLSLSFSLSLSLSLSLSFHSLPYHNRTCLSLTINFTSAAGSCVFIQCSLHITSHDTAELEGGVDGWSAHVTSYLYQSPVGTVPAMGRYGEKTMTNGYLYRGDVNKIGLRDLL